ncbi:hypothetical protein FQZ97_896790 [compost metagenome]
MSVANWIICDDASFNTDDAPVIRTTNWRMVSKKVLNQRASIAVSSRPSERSELVRSPSPLAIPSSPLATPWIGSTMRRASDAPTIEEMMISSAVTRPSCQTMRCTPAITSPFSIKPTNRQDNPGELTMLAM